MTDLATGTPAEAIAALEHERDFIVNEVEVDTSRQCARVTRGVRCTNYLPKLAPESQKYCPQHQPHKRKATGNPREPAPPGVTNKITVNIPGPKLDATQKEVEAGATAMLQLIPMVLAMTGDQVCPEAISAQVPLIAHQLGVLSKYHPALKKLFAPGESTGEGLAWLALVIASLPAILTVCSHHQLLSEGVLERARTFVSFAEGMVADGASDA